MNAGVRVIQIGAIAAMGACVAAVSMVGCTTAPGSQPPAGDVRTAAIRGAIGVEASVAAVVQSERAAKAGGALTGQNAVIADDLVARITTARHQFEALERAGVNPSTATLVDLIAQLAPLIPKGY